MFRPGIYQAPRTTLRHYPLLAAVLTVAALAAGAATFTLPSHPRAVAHHVTANRAARRGPPDFYLDVKRARAGQVRAVLAASVTPTTYTVRPGDTLSQIANREYGHASLWPSLWWVNRREVPNPAALKTGTVLNLSDWHPGKPWLLRAAIAAIPRPPVRHPASLATPASQGGSSPSASSPAPAAPAYSGGSLQGYAQSLFGSQYSCAAAIIERESGWNVYATNPTSGAYGIPQALPGSKMASAGADWATNGDTQLRWMKGYVDSAYGGACAAWSHWQGAGSY